MFVVSYPGQESFMHKLLFNHHRMLHGFAWVAVILLCSAQVLESQHQHEPTVSDEICTLCAFSDTGFTPVSADVHAPLWSTVDYSLIPSTVLTSRPFETHHSRAPPIS